MVKETDSSIIKKTEVQFPYLGSEEIRSFRFIKEIFAEFFGTAMLVFVGCSSAFSDEEPDPVKIAFCFGITVFAIVQIIGHVSGGHINPAVSLALMLGGKIGVFKCTIFIFAQFVGGIIGSALVVAIRPAEDSSWDLGANNLGFGVSVIQATVIETLITMMLVLVVYAVAADPVNASNMKGSAPLAIGLTVTACHLAFIPFTGSSMNPARSFGPMVLNMEFHNGWVYFAGPFIGSILGALIYQLLFQAVETSVI